VGLLPLFSLLLAACAAVTSQSPTPTPAPDPDAADMLLNWQSAERPCQTAAFTIEQISFDECTGVIRVASTEVMGHAERLRRWINTYAPFSAQTRAGNLTFNGRGLTVATPAQQRAIAEWAKVMFQVAQAGRTSAAWGLALAWHREGGIAGFCDDVAVYLDGHSIAASCRSLTPTQVERELTSGQLEQLYLWVDGLRSFEINDDPRPTPPDYLITRLVFSGLGSTSASDLDIQAIGTFASNLAAP